MDCIELVDAFSRGEITDATREHVRSCERCRALIEALTTDAPTTPTIDASLRAAEAEVVRTRKQATKRQILIVALVALIPGALLFSLPFFDRDVTRNEALMASFAAFGIAILFSLPIIVLFKLLSKAGSASGRPLYKRLGPGRMLSGVCLGISESTGWNVTLIRLAFFAALWFKGLGLWAYVLCDVVTQIHPADRQYLLRFKIQRAFRRLVHGAQ